MTTNMQKQTGETQETKMLREDLSSANFMSCKKAEIVSTSGSSSAIAAARQRSFRVPAS